jgi:hypothetical protein
MNVLIRAHCFEKELSMSGEFTIKVPRRNWPSFCYAMHREMDDHFLFSYTGSERDEIKISGITFAPEDETPAIHKDYVCAA